MAGEQGTGKHPHKSAADPTEHHEAATTHKAEPHKASPRPSRTRLSRTRLSRTRLSRKRKSTATARARASTRTRKRRTRLSITRAQKSKDRLLTSLSQMGDLAKARSPIVYNVWPSLVKSTPRPVRRIVPLAIPHTLRQLCRILIPPLLFTRRERPRLRA